MPESIGAVNSRVRWILLSCAGTGLEGARREGRHGEAAPRAGEAKVWGGVAGNGEGNGKEQSQPRATHTGSPSRFAAVTGC
ncbi:hypothetical protein GQ55_3G357400 [Panicum hallii var. hallii]|uniref:Uncharacterized protein n=1 Tax=Panicum hallii var. hallii TaxID=1504633 RepID=A0A2T7EFZ1_9POAL|nr:hypothetical protein GQ55_3G357400 [Panicum hallii var. hallii]